MSTKPAIKPILKWQYEQIIKSLLLIQGHASDAECPCASEGEMCLRKHLIELQALCEETLPIADSEDQKQKLFDLSEEARTYRADEELKLCGKTGKLSGDLVDWARDQRKFFEQISLACSVKPTPVSIKVHSSAPAPSGTDKLEVCRFQQFVRDTHIPFLDRPEHPITGSHDFHRMVIEGYDKTLARLGCNIPPAPPQPFGWPGGKKQLAKTIAAMIPEHKTYVEPFCGAAAVFWRKEPSALEVLNDLDPDLMRFYRDIGSIKQCKISTVSKDWDRLKARTGKLEACEFLSQVLCSFADMRRNRVREDKADQGGGYHRCFRDAPNFHKYLEDYKVRLKGVELHNEDWEVVVRRYDAPGTFFYFDPPYHGTSRDYHHAEDQLARLAKALPLLKGKWLLSYDDHPDVRSAFGNFSIIKVTSNYTVQAGSNVKKGRQLLIANYDVVTPPAPPENKGQFILVGGRVRYIRGTSKYRYETMPEGAWIEKGITGTIIEFHPRLQSFRTKQGEVIEGIEPYAVVKWDNGGITAIDPEDEGITWERIKTTPAPPAGGKEMDKMPLINPHASALKQDEQLRAQMKWLKKYGFKNVREAVEARGLSAPAGGKEMGDAKWAWDNAPREGRRQQMHEAGFYGGAVEQLIEVTWEGLRADMRKRLRERSARISAHTQKMLEGLVEEPPAPPGGEIMDNNSVIKVHSCGCSPPAPPPKGQEFEYGDKIYSTAKATEATKWASLGEAQRMWAEAMDALEQGKGIDASPTGRSLALFDMPAQEQAMYYVGLYYTDKSGVLFGRKRIEYADAYAALARDIGRLYGHPAPPNPPAPPGGIEEVVVGIYEGELHGWQTRWGNETDIGMSLPADDYFVRPWDDKRTHLVLKLSSGFPSDKHGYLVQTKELEALHPEAAEIGKRTPARLPDPREHPEHYRQYGCRYCEHLVDLNKPGEKWIGGCRFGLSFPSCNKWEIWKGMTLPPAPPGRDQLDHNEIVRVEEWHRKFNEDFRKRLSLEQATNYAQKLQESWEFWKLPMSSLLPGDYVKSMQWQIIPGRLTASRLKEALEEDLGVSVSLNKAQEMLKEYGAVPPAPPGGNPGPPAPPGKHRMPPAYIKVEMQKVDWQTVLESLAFAQKYARDHEPDYVPWIGGIIKRISDQVYGSSPAPPQGGTMAEFCVREEREGDDCSLQLVIHGAEVVAEGKAHPVGLYGHPDYAPLYSLVLGVVKNGWPPALKPPAPPAPPHAPQKVWVIIASSQGLVEFVGVATTEKGALEYKKEWMKEEGVELDFSGPWEETVKGTPPAPIALSADESAIPGFGAKLEGCTKKLKAKEKAGDIESSIAVCRSSMRKSQGLPALGAH